MIRSFKSKDLAAFFSGNVSVTLRPLEPQLSRRLQILDSATSPKSLAGLRSNHFEALKGDREGQYSIRVNLQWRRCFRLKAKMRTTSSLWTTIEDPAYGQTGE